MCLSLFGRNKRRPAPTCSQNHSEFKLICAERQDGPSVINKRVTNCPTHIFFFYSNHVAALGLRHTLVSASRSNQFDCLLFSFGRVKAPCCQSGCRRFSLDFFFFFSSGTFKWKHFHPHSCHSWRVPHSCVRRSIQRPTNVPVRHCCDR